MEKLLFPTHPIRCITTGTSEGGKSYFLRKIFLNSPFNFEQKYIYSPSLHQASYQKVIKCFGNYMPRNILPNILIEEDIDLVIDARVNDKDFEKSDTEIETYESLGELKYPQEYDSDQPITITFR